MSTPLVIIPTYNESDNIEKLIQALLAKNVHVLVVDDNSPDGTSDIVKKLSEAYPQDVHLIVRSKGKDGRGGAVLAGFEWALQREYDPIIEMDADFSHDPEELPRILAASEKADMIVGSRYLPGSEILNWPLRRRIFSRMANTLARTVVGLPLSDYTNGYRSYRRKILKTLRPELIPEKGYIVLSYIAAQLAANGATLSEVPTRFVNRQRGASQMTRSEIFQALRGIMRLRKYVKKGPRHTTDVI